MVLENILLRGGWMPWPGVAFKIREKREESLRAVSGVRTGDSNKAHPSIIQDSTAGGGVPKDSSKERHGGTGEMFSG